MTFSTGMDSANGIDTTVVTTTTTNGHTHVLDSFTRTTNGTSWDSSSGGDWIYFGDPDMTDWPADDIFDYYAKDLARRRPA